MPIDVLCTGCGKKLRAPDTAAGKKIKCPACAAVLSVPAQKFQALPPAAPEPVPDKAVAPSLRPVEELDEVVHPRRTNREDEDEERVSRRGPRRDAHESEPSGTVPLVLGIVSIVLAVLATPLAFMSCCPPIGFIAAGLAGLGLLLGGGGTIMGFVQKRGLPCPIIGTVLSVVALIIVLAWGLFWGGTMLSANKEVSKKLQEEQRIREEANKKLQDELKKKQEDEKKLLEKLAPKEYNPNDSQAGEWKSQSKKNLRELALAMFRYQKQYGHLPPPKDVGLGKKPTAVSWRVNILPFLDPKAYPDAAQLHGKFKLDEAWDSPDNTQVRNDNAMPAVFASPLAVEGDKRTNYQIIVGAKTPWPNDRAKPKPGNFTDGTSNTFLIVEAKTPVTWTQPEDLRFNGKDVPPLGGIFGGDFHAAMADGAVYFFRRANYPDNLLVPFITANGGEVTAALPKD